MIRTVPTTAIAAGQYGLFEDATEASPTSVPLAEATTAARRPAGPEAAPSWTDREADELREVLLTQTLLTLQDGRAAPETVEECWAWILSDRAGGFAFVTCARQCGCDPEALRVLFQAELRRHTAATIPTDGQLDLANRPWDWLGQAD